MCSFALIFTTSQTPANILRISDRFKVAWPHARTDAAKMIPNQPFRCFSYEKLMGISTIRTPEIAIAMSLCSCPKPAITEMGRIARDGAVLVDLGPEALLRGKLGTHDGFNLRGATPGDGCTSLRHFCVYDHFTPRAGCQPTWLLSKPKPARWR